MTSFLLLVGIVLLTLLFLTIVKDALRSQQWSKAEDTRNNLPKQNEQLCVAGQSAHCLGESQIEIDEPKGHTDPGLGEFSKVADSKSTKPKPDGSPEKSTIGVDQQIGTNTAEHVLQSAATSPESNMNLVEDRGGVVDHKKSEAAVEIQSVQSKKANHRASLSDEQQQIFDLIETSNQNVWITGKAGTGKSFLLRYIKQNTKKRCVVLAPTGLAALNVGGQTIHSFFRLRPRVITPKTSLPWLKNSRKIDLIIIDEISMVRADLFDAIDKIMRKSRGSDKPFGGVQVVLFGDLYQLPPVVTEDEQVAISKMYDRGYFFETEAWRSGGFKCFELVENFRQRDQEFLDILNKIRVGEATQSDLDKLNTRVCDTPPEDAVILASRNHIVEEINKEKLAQLPGGEYRYIGEISVTGEADREKSSDVKSLPTAIDLRLKVGAKVMLQNNHSEGYWVNGTIGVISDLSEDYVEVEIDGDRFSVERYTWEFYSYELDAETGHFTPHVYKKFTQFPIKLAWALTVHKSQGQTLDRVYLNLDADLFERGQLYVALSRVRCVENLYLSRPLTVDDITVDPSVVRFMKELDLGSRFGDKKAVNT